MPLPPDPEPPAVFARATATLRALIDAPDPADRMRRDVVLREVNAPTRIAPFALALSASVSRPGVDDEPAGGRLVLLHDPVGQDAWQGTSRFVAFLRAPLEAELAADPVLAGVVWSWFTEALSAQGAALVALGGTVTVTSSHRFGSLAATGATHEVELRCSWTPVDLDADLAAHVCGYTDALAVTAGLPPQGGRGPVALGRRRTGAGHGGSPYR